MRMFQCVLKSKKKSIQIISSYAKNYIAALLISRGRKNCSSQTYFLNAVKTIA